MRELREIQGCLDTCGPLDAHPDDAAFQKAMTLRDCTCYVYLSRGNVSVRLGDLDRKDGTAKGEYWRRTERTLIDGGFYTARSIIVSDSTFAVPVSCVLGEASPVTAAAPAIEVVPVDLDLDLTETDGLADQGAVLLGTRGTRGGNALIRVREVDTLRAELEQHQQQQQQAVRGPTK